MANLHVRNVPDQLYRRLQRLAADKRMSLSAQVIGLLEEALAQEDARVRHLQILAQMKRDRYRYPPGVQVPDSTELIREDRER